ncbi:MAG: type II toxin-antitoxin system HicA family toxin [Candidatus Vogelbacteria bacterium]|nr:type II toxin-antitoxin system HicA family toxin [Candidatus Vogelbacteria bacterium]
MPKLTPISPAKMMKILKSLGFSLIRIKGSHHFFHCAQTGKNTIVPQHSKETLDVSLIRQILNQIDLNIEEYDKLRQKV